MKSLLCLIITIVWIWWRGLSLSRVYQVPFGSLWPLLHGAGSTLRRWAAVFWMKEWEPPNKKTPMLPVANCGSFAGAPMDPSFSEEYCGVTSVKLKIGVGLMSLCWFLLDSRGAVQYSRFVLGFALHQNLRWTAAGHGAWAQGSCDFRRAAADRVAIKKTLIILNCVRGLGSGKDHHGLVSIAFRIEDFQCEVDFFESQSLLRNPHCWVLGSPVGLDDFRWNPWCGWVGAVRFSTYL